MDSTSSGHMLSSQTGFQIPQYILDDLCARFVINLPEEESRDPIRVFFQIELAQWFYLDFYCPENPELRPLSIKEFSTQVFRHCPSLSKHVDNFDSILESWKEYKMAVPTYGAILLDPSLQYCLLVQGYWVKASWGFPKGKVNQDEPPMECAIREVLEETGFDIRNMVKAEEYLEYKMNDQLSRLYIVHGVPKDTTFNARTRNEIKSFEWFRVDHLPSHKKDLTCKQNIGLNANAFFMVIPFVKNLRRWISHKLDTSAFDKTSTAGTQRIERGSRPVAAGSQRCETGSRTTSKATIVKETEAKQRTTPRDNNKLRMESVSPRHPPSHKQLLILKRDCTKLEAKIACDVCAVVLPHADQCAAAAAVAAAAAGQQFIICPPPAWTNFRLDIDAVLAAMFASHNAPPAQSASQSHSVRIT